MDADNTSQDYDEDVENNNQQDRIPDILNQYVDGFDTPDSPALVLSNATFPISLQSSIRKSIIKKKKGIGLSIAIPDMKETKHQVIHLH